jgi:DNA repair protein RadC
VQLCPLVSPAMAFRPGPPRQRVQVTTPDSALAVVRPLLADRDRECGVLVALDTRHRVIATTLISVGTAATTFLAPREVYRDALLLGASAVVVAHNHPSGDPTPSADDERITRRLAEAGAMLGVDLLDHLVVGDPDWTSLARVGTGGL